MMYMALAIFASLIGLFVTGVALFTAWSVYLERKASRSRLDPPSEPSASEGEPITESESAEPALAITAPSEGAHAKVSQTLLQGWMVWDWAVVLLFGIGAVFLFTDLLAVGRERDQYQYPPYHYGYLLCGFVFCIVGMLFAFARIVTLLNLNRGNRTARPDHPYEPEHAD